MQTQIHIQIIKVVEWTSIYVWRYAHILKLFISYQKVVIIVVTVTICIIAFNGILDVVCSNEIKIGIYTIITTVIQQIPTLVTKLYDIDIDLR